MKLRLTLLCLIGLCSVAFAAPGETLKTNTLTFAWDPNPVNQGIVAYHLYYRTNELAGMTLTNAGGVHSFVPLSIDPGWTHLAATADTRITITNFGARFAIFSVTASNMYGESLFSNVAWIPAPLGDQERRLRVTEVK